MRCGPCPVEHGPCHGPALGLCGHLEGPHAAAWARHIVARSALPAPAPEPIAPARIGTAPARIEIAPARIGPALAAVMACDRRGPEVEGAPCGCGHAPTRRCADGRDVTLAQCLACVAPAGAAS